MDTAHVLFHCRFATPGNLEESRHLAKATRLRLSQTKRLLSFLSTKEELLATCNVRTKHTATARSVQRPTGSHLALSGKPSASLSTPKQGHSMGCRLDGINVIHVQPVPPGGRNDACSCLSAWCRHHGLLLHLCRLLPLLFSHFLPRLTSPSARATVVSTSRPADTTHTQSQQNKVRMSRTYDIHFVYPCSNCSSSGHIRGSLRHVSSGCATSWSAMCSHGSTDSLLSWRCWIQRNRPPTIGLRNPPARLHGLLLTAAHTSSAPDRAGQRHLPGSANESTRFLTQHTAFRPHLRISKPGRKKASHSHASHAPPGLVCLPTGERQSR